MPDSRTTNFSLRSITGPSGTYPSARPGRIEEAEVVPAAPAATGGNLSGLDPCDPRVETLPPFRSGDSGEWGGGPSPISMPSMPVLKGGNSGPAPGGIGITWHPLEESPAAPAASTPTTKLVFASPSVVGAAVEAPPPPATDDPLAVSISASSPAPAAGTRKRRWQWWDAVVGTLVLVLVSYLLLAGGLYASRLWQARHTNSVTLLQNLGHGGLSQVTVVFAHNHLMVTEIDNDDPTRVTVLQVNEAIVLSTDKTVLEAWFQIVIQPGRLDLVMQLDGGLDPMPYHPQFTTILVNNVAAIKKDPHAPGLRAPTNAELQQALQKLST